MLATQVSHISSRETNYDVVIVGAGPYGLSIAAHLSGRGMDVAIFGKPLQLWREHMPKGMLLRSYWWASSLSDPYKQYSIESYLKETGQPAIDPFPAEAFINYGLQFQKYLVPQVDETYVSCIERTGGYFTLTLADGRIIHSQTVIMAIGQGYYVYKPTEYTHLPPQLVTHTSDHYEFKPLVGKEVVIVGSGQGALETAALAHESGVHVHLLIRHPLVWTENEPQEHSPLERVLHPKGGMGTGWMSWGLEHFPYAFHRLPKPTKARIVQRIFGPIGAYWLKSRILGKVTIHESQQVEHIKEMDSHIELQLSDHKRLKVDHIILATGYRVDIRKLPMLHSSLLPEIRTYCGAPVLNNYFESSVPELYFVGFPSAMSFGPLYRFIIGTDAAAKRITSAIARKPAHTKLHPKEQSSSEPSSGVGSEAIASYNAKQYQTKMRSM